MSPDLGSSFVPIVRYIDFATEKLDTKQVSFSEKSHEKSCLFPDVTNSLMMQTQVTVILSIIYPETKRRRMLYEASCPSQCFPLILSLRHIHHN